MSSKVLLGLSPPQWSRLVEHFNDLLDRAARSPQIDSEHVAQCLSALDVLSRAADQYGMTNEDVASAAQGDDSRKMRRGR